MFYRRYNNVLPYIGDAMSLRKAAEMALDALDMYREHDAKNIGLADAAYEALRQALAQPDEVLAERERCAKIALSGTGEPVQVATLKILRKERERIAANIMEIDAELKEKNHG